jgi:hypothetical protein
LPIVEICLGTLNFPDKLLFFLTDNFPCRLAQIRIQNDFFCVYFGIGKLRERTRAFRE